MTLVTAEVSVLTKQRKSCQVVVERNTREPVRRGMTRLTNCSELPLVRVVVLVTRAAVLRQRVCQVPGMAGDALQLLMAWRQIEACSCAVIESGG